MRVSVCQMTCRADKAENTAAALRLLGEAAARGAEVAVLPEYFDYIGPEEGMLACGYEGLGRLWKIEDIAFRAEFLLARQENLIA